MFEFEKEIQPIIKTFEKNFEFNKKRSKLLTANAWISKFLEIKKSNNREIFELQRFEELTLFYNCPTKCLSLFVRKGN